MADIAAIFHWPLSEMDALTLTELHRWQALAVDRFKKLQPRQEE